jgi:hypothetical protein
MIGGRRLAPILAADATGYNQIDQAIDAHHGRIRQVRRRRQRDRAAGSKIGAS